MAKEVLQDLYDKTSNPASWYGISPESVMGGVTGAGKMAAGIYGMFQPGISPDVEAKSYKSTYQESPQLKALRDMAFAKAFAGSDDYASRIRAKNVHDNAVKTLIAHSGGSRGFIASNIAGADDAENLANLGIDKANRDAEGQKIGLATQLEGAVMNDKLNKVHDEQYANKDSFEKFIAGMNFNRANTIGSMGLVSGGLGDITHAFTNEKQWGKNGIQTKINKAKLLLAAKKSGIDLETGLPTEGDPFKSGTTQDPKGVQEFPLVYNPNFAGAFDGITNPDIKGLDLEDK